MNYYRHTAVLCAIALTSLLLTMCARKADEGSLSFTIRGKLENSAGDKIFLSSPSADGFVVRDSAISDNTGAFSFTGNILRPDIFRLSLNDTSGVMLVIDGPLIEVSADARDPESTLVVNGSKESALLQQWMQVDRKFRSAARGLEERFDRARAGGFKDSLSILQERYVGLEDARETEAKAFIRRYPDSFVATYAAYRMLLEGGDATFVDSMLTAFNASLPGARYVGLLNERTATTHSVDVGEIAPGITLSQPGGTPLALSSLRGQYVLIDFWASWCRPCRQENPAMVKLYEKYHDRGFEILGVSLDESRERWVQAIDADKLPWRHVSDLQGAGSPVVHQYQVQAVPMTVLVDREGRIAALNLRGARLEAKLAQLLPADENSAPRE